MAKKPGGSPRRGLLGKRITNEQINAIYLRNFEKSPGLLGEPPDPVSELHLKKMVGLLLHYGIDRKSPDCWFQLSYALALKHEVGFKVAEKTGPKERYGDDFVRAVEEIRQRRPELKSNKMAFAALQNEGKYPGELPTLEKRLREAKANRRAREEQEEALRVSRDALIQEAMRAEKNPTQEAANRKKRRN